MKISSLVIAIVMVGLFAGVFGMFFANVGDQYNQDYNTTNLGLYNKTQDITTQLGEIESGLDTEGGETGNFDLIGGFLKKGFAVIKVTFQSFGLLNEMSDVAIDELDERTGNANLQIFKTALTAVVAVLFLFIVISVLVGRDI